MLPLITSTCCPIASAVLLVWVTETRELLVSWTIYSQPLVVCTACWAAAPPTPPTSAPPIAPSAFNPAELVNCAPATPPAAAPVVAPTVPSGEITTCRTPMITPRCTCASCWAASAA